eukprot:681420-Lingulodinium_polyedra.AAC.1
MEENQRGALWAMAETHGRKRTDARDPLETTATRFEDLTKTGGPPRATATIWGSAPAGSATDL